MLRILRVGGRQRRGKVGQHQAQVLLLLDRAQRYPDEEPFALAVEHPCYGRPEVFTTLEASREITAGPNLGI